MSNHLRHCAKHKKPFPCVHCAVANEAKEAKQRANGTPAPPIEPVEKRKRGRPQKYADDQQRKAIDAQRKKDERAISSKAEAIEQAQANHSDNRGSQGELSGGFDSEAISRKADRYQKAELLGAVQDPDNPEISVPDRKRTSVPINPDKREYSNKEMKGGMTREDARSLRVWIHGPQKTKRSCVDYHQSMAEKHKDSKVKVYCGRCKKLLVNPGKAVRGIFSDVAPKASDAA